MKSSAASKSSRQKRTTPKSSAVSKSPRRKIAFFQPGQIVYLISHTSERGIDQLEDEQVAKLIEWSNSSRSGLSKLHISNQRKISFQFSPKLESAPQYPLELPRNVRYKVPQVASPQPFTLVFADVTSNNEPANGSDLVKLITDLDEQRGAKNYPLGKDNPLDLVSPSWLSTVSSESGGTGGPGARPVPFKGRSDTKRYKIHLPPDLEKAYPTEKDRGKGVKVAILDTAPSLHDLAAAYESWHKVGPRPKPTHRHWLLESLLRPGGPLHVHPASLDALLRMRSVHLETHNYPMTDHGLFIAGIVHTIAPAAEIHLIEVLNSDGVGDIESIAQGLQLALNELSAGPLVVNCSLMLNIPLEDEYSLLGDLAELLPIRDEQWRARQGLLIQKICDQLYLQNSRVVAAAGNDRKGQGKARPAARYPAAFDSVLGVGAYAGQAKTKQGTAVLQASSYSNLADQPSSIGVVTYGGDATPDGMTDPKRGVLGLYLGRFPLEPGRSTSNPEKLGPPSKNNWAWWTGTSFATPMVTGAIAVTLGVSSLPRAPQGPTTTQNGIGKLYQVHAIQNDQTDQKEDGMIVTQS